MKDSAPDDTVVERLRAALEAGALPSAARDHASHLLKRLVSPVQVTLLGFPGSGKSELLNMFIGQQFLPKGAGLPTVELTWGPVEKVTLTDTNGRNRVQNGLDLSSIDRESAAFLRVEMPKDILKRISLLEVVTGGASAEMESAVDWAVRRTDIALWCTQEFGPRERALWTRVPDGLKDHAFLILTKADVLSAGNELSDRIAALESVVAEEFHSMFAVATLQAIKAHKADGRVDEAVYHASGGGALKAEILRHAERGRRADFDSAHLFLARYQVADVPTRTPRRPDPEADAEAAGSASDAATGAARPDMADTATVENAALFSGAVTYLRRRGETLWRDAAERGPGDTAPIVQQCLDAVEHLSDLFAQDDSGCPAADAFLDDLSEATDLMVLMQAESGDAPAADAVTLLLQLRRDMEMKLAA